jgi:peptidoglycan LD-endopeptidase CwlK
MKSLQFKLSFFMILLSLSFAMNALSQEIIIDSKLTFEQAMSGKSVPHDILKSLCLIDVKYFSFDSKLHQGQLIINKSVKSDIEKIFALILKEKFPVEKVIPICNYDWDDDSSMSANNTSSFNYRNIAGTNRLSRHALGMAIDINPFLNPVEYKDGSIIPKGAKYNVSRLGTFSINHPIVKAFDDLGWQWGGEFNSYKDNYSHPYKDNHHFDKIEETIQR